MVRLTLDPLFERSLQRIRHPVLRERIAKLVRKIAQDPETGKPMRFSRKGSREVYLPPFRLSYHYAKEDDLILFIELYHKDEQ